MVSSIIPAEGNNNKETAITITGENFVQGAEVRLSGNPTLSGSYNTPGSAEGVYIVGDYAYVADGESVLQIIRVSYSPLTDISVLDAQTISSTVPRGLPVGSYDVVVTNPDGYSDIVVDGFTMLVDTEPPKIVCPEDFVVTTSELTTTVNYPQIVISDDTDPNPLVICEPPFGSSFSLGTKTVCVTATDALGKSSQCTFTVTISYTSNNIMSPWMVLQDDYSPFLLFGSSAPAQNLYSQHNTYSWGVQDTNLFQEISSPFTMDTQVSPDFNWGSNYSLPFFSQLPIATPSLTFEWPQ